jgi:hypothetical protein
MMDVNAGNAAVDAPAVCPERRAHVARRDARELSVAANAMARGDPEAAKAM